MPIITLNMAALKATALFTSNDATRYNINHIEITTTAEYTQYVGTNGHCLLCVRDSSKPPDTMLEEALLLPAYRLPKEKSVRKEVITHCFYDSDSSIFHYHGEKTVVEAAKDCGFPDYSGLAKTEPTECTMQFDPEYLMLFKKAAILLGDKSGWVHVAHVATLGDPSRVTLPNCPMACGIIMPVRLDAGTFFLA